MTNSNNPLRTLNAAGQSIYRLEREGVAIFARAFTNLLNHLEAKAASLAA